MENIETVTETQEERNKRVLGTLITWIAQSAAGVLSIGEASILLNDLETPILAKPTTTK